MKLAAEVTVVLELEEVRKAPGPRPTIVSQRSPLVVVLGRASDGDDGVHRRGASRYLPTGIRHLSSRDGGCLKLPIVGLERGFESVGQVVRELVDRGIVRTRLQEQNPPIGVFCETSSHCRSG